MQNDFEFLYTRSDQSQMNHVVVKRAMLQKQNVSNCSALGTII